MKSRFVAALGAALLVGATAASAAPVTYVFSGAISEIQDATGVLLGSGIEIGTPLSVSLSWDEDTVPDLTGPWPTGGIFSRFPESSTFQISALVGGTRSLTSSTAFAVVIDDDPDFGDQFLVISQHPLVFDAPRLGTDQLQIGGCSYLGTTLSTSEALPTAAEMQEFEASICGIYFFAASFADPDDDDGPYYGFGGQLRFAPVPVPEPASLALLGLGLAGLGLSRRRKA